MCFQIPLSCSISKRLSNLIQTEMFFWWLDYVFKHQYFEHENRDGMAANRNGTCYLSAWKRPLYNKADHKIERNVNYSLGYKENKIDKENFLA